MMKLSLGALFSVVICAVCAACSGSDGGEAAAVDASPLAKKTPASAPTGSPAAPSGSASSEGGPSMGTIPFRFDVVTIECGAQLASCPATDDKCFCDTEQQAINYTTSKHYISMPTSAHRAEIKAAGNAMAAYEDTLNAGYAAGLNGKQAADEVMAQLAVSYENDIPQWIILNEISKGQWATSGRSYRQYVVDFVRTIKNDYNKLPIVCSPYGLPAAYTDKLDWDEVAKWAHIAVEVQLSGQEVVTAGFSVQNARSVYQASITSYADVNVAKDRLMILDNFDNSVAATAFGRQGVSHDAWVHAVGVRADAVASLNVFGYVSYAWGGNQVHDTSANRLDYMAEYAKRSLP